MCSTAQVYPDFLRGKPGCVVLVETEGIYNKSPLLKRIVAIPGDRYEFSNGDFYLNGKRQTESYAIGKTFLIEGDDTTYFYKSNVAYTLGENEYLVLGDNREHSADSRDFGPVERRRILGYANDPIHKELNRCNESETE